MSTLRGAESTALDGMDLGIRPDTFRADPIERTSKASGTMGNVYFVWPTWKRAKQLTLVYQDLELEQARRLVAAFGPRTQHNKVLSVDLHTEVRHYIIPGGVDIRVTGSGRYWSVELSTFAVDYQELGGLPVGRVAQIHTSPVQFAVYRYGYLYIVHQNQLVSVMEPTGLVHQWPLTFMPQTWSSYGGRFILYNDPHPLKPNYNTSSFGAAVFAGASKLVEDTGGGTYTAPLAILHRNRIPIYGGSSDDAIPLDDLNGLPYETPGINLQVPTVVDALGQTFYQPPVAALYEPHEHLLLFEQRQGFSYYNGSVGHLLYADAQQGMVPYAYPSQGLLAAGAPNGYYFSPDLGISWRFRYLDGIGVVTENAVLTVKSGDGVYREVGSWSPVS